MQQGHHDTADLDDIALDQWLVAPACLKPDTLRGLLLTVSLWCCCVYMCFAVPVEAIVLPPVSSRLPWSTCVLSVCMAGRVALTCLASGITTRTFDGWDLGPPAQLAWSTGRWVQLCLIG